MQLAPLRDPVTTGHILYRDECQIQYSGVMYVSPHEQGVFAQLLRSLHKGIHTKMMLFFVRIVEIMWFYD